MPAVRLQSVNSIRQNSACGFVSVGWCTCRHMWEKLSLSSEGTAYGHILIRRYYYYYYYYYYYNCTESKIDGI